MTAAMDSDDVGPAENDADACVLTPSHNRMLSSTSSCRTLSAAAAETQHPGTSLTQDLEFDDGSDITSDGQMLYFYHAMHYVHSTVLRSYIVRPSVCNGPVW